MRKKVAQEIKKPEKAEFFMVSLRACTIGNTENGSTETYDLTVAQYQGKAGRQAVNLLLLHLCTYYPRHYLFIWGLTWKIFRMSHQDQDWFIIWFFSKQNLFYFTKTKQNKRASKQKTEGRNKGLHFGLRNRNIINIFSAISVFPG